MNERNKGLFPLVLGAGVLSVCGLFFGLFLWLSQPSIPSGSRIAGEARSGPMSDSLSTLDAIPSGYYDYGGSATMVPIRQAVETLLSAEASDFLLNYVNPIDSAPNSTRGIDMLLSGEIAFADASRSIRPEEYEIAEQLGFELQQTPVAIDGVAVTVHPDLDIEGLTVQQLKDIYLGNIVNWREVGGPDLAIQAFSMLPSTSGTANFFSRRILKREPLSDRVTIVTETTPVLRQVAATPGSIYYVSAPLAVPQCSVKTLPIATAADRPYVAPYLTPPVDPAACPRQRNEINRDAFRNGTYPLLRRLFVISKKGDSSDAIAGQAYGEILLSAEGQMLVEQSGFVSIR
ncbi:MAG: PstS family phosphate ABC transporter substrate-binding protein [Cyanobacteria bacterium J06614_10]